MQVKPDVKNSVFIDLFGQEENQLKLFQALHPDMEDVGIGDLKAITIQQVLLTHTYNDFAMLVKDKMMVFVEAQSTWTGNILLRLLEYYAETVHGYTVDLELDVYSSKTITIPKPEFYVIYTGKRKVEKQIITLRKDFFKDESYPIDLEATVLSTETEDIIGQYIAFCRVMDDQVKAYGRTEEAAWETIRICSDRGVLREYLAGREKEVVTIMKKLFDEEYARQIELKATAREAEAKGRAEGREETIVSNIKNMMKNLGFSLQKALDALGITDSEERTRIAGMIR